MPLSSDIQGLSFKTQENFPVASFLFPAFAREPLLHFYALARNADNIADAADLPAEEKKLQLEILYSALEAGDRKRCPDWALAYLEDVGEGKTHISHALALLGAFLQDVRQNRYADMASLLGYCRYSAAPVGRVVLELCREPEPDIEAADALCMALQLLNHMQDCRDDYVHLNRIYLPQDWMEKFGVSETMLMRRETPQPLRLLFNDYLMQCRILLARARKLPATIHDPRLRMEIGLTIELAGGLARQLFWRDPLAEKVRVPKWQWLWYMAKSMRYV